MKLHKPFALLLGLSLVLTGCASQENTKEEIEQKDTEIQKEQNIQIEVKTLVKEETGPYLNISYPVISGMLDQEEEKKLNKNFYNDAKRMENTVREYEETIQQYSTPNLEEHAGGSITVRKYVNNERIISLDCYLYENAGGTGMEGHQPFVYDLKEKKLLTFADLFEDNVVPKEEIIKLLNDTLSSNKYEELDAEPISEMTNEQPFYLTEDSVVFLFSKYEISYGAAGAPEIEILKAEIPNLKEIYQ